MLIKLSLRNIRRSMRDYAIYFFTLIIGVSIFYVFNAVGGQAAMLQVSASANAMVKLLRDILSGVSVFVAFVLALLIVYASRFLMKRRNREFALYMLLGMSKGKISRILLTETILIGAVSLGVGLLVGLGASQVMSAIVVRMFDADMSAYRLSISPEAMGKTVLYFAIMYLAVVLFNSTSVTRMKLIDLIQSERKSEQIRLRNPILCVVLFVISVCVLGAAYYAVGIRYESLSRNKLLLSILAGVVCTFVIFWSVSGMFLRVIMSLKGVYYKGLNAFTFRQVSSKVNTMVTSMSVICLMLFLTICLLSSAFSVRNSMNSNLRELCPADAQYRMALFANYDDPDALGDFAEIYRKYGYDLTEDFRDYVHFRLYGDPSFTLGVFLGPHLDALKSQFRFMDYDTPQQLIAVSDYNALRTLYGKETLTLGSDEYLLLCDYKNMLQILNLRMADSPDITVCGHTLHSAYPECRDGFIDLSTQHMNPGFFVVPDEVVNGEGSSAIPHVEEFIGHYNAETKAEKQEIEERVKTVFTQVRADWEASQPDLVASIGLNTKFDIFDAVVGLGAILTFLGMYIGLVFLMACGAILALKELSESIDSLPRYEMLRKIGAEESEISHSLLIQTGLFFLLPLVLAVIHSIFGMRFASELMIAIGTQKVQSSSLITAGVLLVIYGGYFLITYFNSRMIIRERR
ncbi:MAG: FtsX-like permease family protein [Lachnospiraceae bacterium]|nr:FtsX-like permease family protein [Lachnospiraceae bacterium]